MTTRSEGSVRANGVNFRYIEQGAGRLMLCLHGFPDHAWTWRNQLDAFSAAGFRVVAPFMRGYAPTGLAPDGRYQGAVLGQDVVALIDALGDGNSAREPAIVVGHDWGATAAYAAAVIAPSKIGRLVTLSVPYGPALGRAMIGNPLQQRRSWYIYLFLMKLADAALPHDDFALVDRLWREWSPEWSVPPDYMAELKRTFRSDGVANAALAYYRQAFVRELQDPALAPLQARIGKQAIAVPALYLHGANDGCIGAEVALGMESLFAAGLETIVIPAAGHFVHLEKPEAVNEAIGRFVG